VTASGAGALLVILPHNPGDVVMALQAIRHVKADFPGLDVDYLVGEECLDLVQGSPLIRKTLVLPKRALKAAWNAGDSPGVLARMEAFLSDLGSVRYRLSANLFQERWGGLIQSFVEADRKIGLEFVADRNYQVKSRFLEHLAAIPADRAGNAWHAVDIYVRAITRGLSHPDDHPADAVHATELGIARDSSPENAFNATQHRVTAQVSRAATQRKLPQRRAENAASILPPLIRPDAAKLLVPGEYLAFHPGSAWPGKRWPESHWSGLATRCARAGFTLAFTGAPEDRPMMDRILSGMDPGLRSAVVDCVGTTTLPGAAWVCAHARMVVSGDTVAMHLAAAAGAPTLSLFGASNPVETGPYGKGHVIIQTDVQPHPDLAFAKEHPGLAHLRAEEVAEYLLEGTPPPGFALWETGWDPDRRMQVLHDRKRQPHPNLERAERLLRTLDREADRPQAQAQKTNPVRNEPRDKLRRILTVSASRPDAENLAALALAEREWAEETQTSLIWEAYRIAGNGLPVGDLRAHLTARLSRLESAIREEVQAAAP